MQPSSSVRPLAVAATALLLSPAFLLGRAPLVAAGPTAADLAPSAEAPAPVAFAWKWAEGDVVRYRVENTSETEISTSMFPESMSTDMRQVMGLSQEVTGVTADGVATLRAVYDSLEIDAEVPGQGAVSWSSEAPDAPGAELAGPFAFLLDRPVVLRIDRRGEVLEVEGMAELVRSLLDELAEDDEEAAAVMRPMMDELLTEESILEMTRQGLLVFPEEPLAPGDSWTREMSVEVPVIGTMTHRQTYTLERLEGDEAVFSLDGQVEMGGDGEALELEMLAAFAETMEIDLATRRGEISGLLRFDRARGLLVRQEMTVGLDLVLTMTPLGEAVELFPDGLTMEVATTSRSVQSLVEE